MKWVRKNSELLAWLIALTIPFFIDPAASDHFTICLFHHLGFEHCPGCGLGRSIAWLYRGEITQSFETHFLAIPAVCMLGYRILQLTIKHPKIVTT